jgi:hypothetical protein
MVIALAIVGGWFAVNLVLLGVAVARSRRTTVVRVVARSHGLVSEATSRNRTPRTVRHGYI